jgi:hypothetical protein
MTVPIYIENGHGGGNFVRVEEDGALLSSQVPYPPLLPQQAVPFIQFLSIDGTPTGSTDMLVDGSITPQEFFIQATSEGDIYVSAINFVLSDANATLKEFASFGSPLTNGLRLFYERSSGEIDIFSEATTNFKLVRFCLGSMPFGDGPTLFRANDISGNSEGYLPTLYLNQLLPPYGIKLDIGTTQRLVLEINDDVSGADQFDAIAYGFKRLPNS